MQQYHVLLKEILGKGDVQFEPRTKEYILGKSGASSTYDTRVGFPIITSKNVPPRLPFEEVFWKLRGERNVLSLVQQNIHFWTKNAYDRYLSKRGKTGEIPKHSNEWNVSFENYKTILLAEPELADYGDLGPVYGYQWRHWPSFKKVSISGFENVYERGEIDQLDKLVKGIKEKPGSRYHTLLAYNVADLEEMALGPCPFWHQFSVWANGYMDLAMGQRSCDSFLGIPFNIAQDALLLHMVANETGFKPRYLSTQLFNVHAYLGVPPRSDFWMDSENVAEFQRRFAETEKLDNPEKFLELRDWYLKNASSESEGNERKDHIPFILMQLSKPIGKLPRLEIKSGVPLLDAIEMPAVQTEKEMGYAELIGYNPAKWDSKADMAA